MGVAAKSCLGLGGLAGRGRARVQYASFAGGQRVERRGNLGFRRREEILAWFAQGVLLDGVAAMRLVERGLGRWIGFTSGRLVSQNDIRYSIERCTDAEFALRENVLISVNSHPYAARLFQGELMKGARAVSEILDPGMQVVGQGSTVFENELGGRVVVVPWSADDGVMLNGARTAQLSAFLRYLDPEGTHGSVAGGPWLVPQFLRDGQRWRGVVWNASPDSVDKVTVQFPKGMGRVMRGFQVDATGRIRISACGTAAFIWRSRCSSGSSLCFWRDRGECHEQSSCLV